ncbi:protein SOB FIVE-LIKE 4-like [Telopea speciosissima]|uniref:protein SOB FIVE-LIKE 4-like n=1 Tax=Telopea speciosissima TaxID=54955 RepID=UPI001CC42787|nr:protein SOB FIVE-LIKE 4-like [Telopea speciosissima]
MEPSSQLFGETEECSSSESGWTTYIASPVHCDDTQEDDDDDDEKDGNNDSDDSMASDASTGPNHGEGELLCDSGEDDKKCYSYTKTYRNKKKEKKKDEDRGRSEAVKQESVEMANSATSSVNSSVKLETIIYGYILYMLHL